MTASNPQLSLTVLNDLEARIMSNSETVKDYEDLDFFLSSIGLTGALMSILNKNGMTSYAQYIADKKNPYFANSTAVNAVTGYVAGLLNGLKSYAQSNNLII